MIDDRRPCPWVVCALRKAGGRELGFGSDIELVFVYQGEGTTEGEKVDNFRFFGELVRTLAESVQGRREGIFQIDLRLRPHGSAGSLAASLDGFRSYYSLDGDARQFERMALVKLRTIAGDQGLGRQVTEARDQYVYSNLPIDLLDIVHMRERQADELVARDRASAKHSAGGIVDVEYFAQAKQIQAGAADPSVRTPNTALERLAEAGALDRGRSETLRSAYGFLRRLIDALRIVRGNAKDLTIPDPGSREFAYLARRLDYDSTEDLQNTIERHMTAASTVWTDWTETTTTATPN
jgi:glutamate-ammonia-ligase adenylyltransferase